MIGPSEIGVIVAVIVILLVCGSGFSKGQKG